MTLRITLYALASLLLGAHYLRAGNLAMVALSVAVPLLFFYRRRASLLVLQVLAYCAGAIWLAAAIDLVQERMQLGRPWTLGAVILGSVALFTLVAGLLLNSRAITARYPAAAPQDESDAG